MPTSIDTYNTWIQDRAAAGHTDIQDYSSTFNVVGSTAAVDARDNTATTLHLRLRLQGRAHLLAERQQGGRRLRGLLQTGVLGRRRVDEDGRRGPLSKLPRIYGQAAGTTVQRRELAATLAVPWAIMTWRQDGRTIVPAVLVPLVVIKLGAQTRIYLTNSTACRACSGWSPTFPPRASSVITGTPEVNKTLTADISGIMDADGLPAADQFSYRWVRNDGAADSDISGATDSTYKLKAADLGQTIKVKVTFTDESGIRGDADQRRHRGRRRRTPTGRSSKRLSASISYLQSRFRRAARRRCGSPSPKQRLCHHRRRRFHHGGFCCFCRHRQ